MKILFVCGSLEPGRDGVGDYIRRLAITLQHQKHLCFAVAFNDYYINKKTYQSQLVIDGYLEVLRLPAGLKMCDKVIEFKRLVDTIHPDWISLQYVPYAFHSKGLPFLLANYFSKIRTVSDWHIMFHELWVGSCTKSLRIKFLSYLQKLIIRKMVYHLKPSLIHTQLPLNHRKLNRLGFNVKLLPLFSNILVCEKGVQNIIEKVFTIGIFSRIELNPTIFRFLNDIERNLSAEGLQVHVHLIGGSESKMTLFKKELEKNRRFIGYVLYSGFLSDIEISMAIKGCQLGLTGVPRHALGKSGSVMAFLAHGIPVAAPIINPGHNALEFGFESPHLSLSIVQEPSLKSYQAALNNVQEAKKEIQVNQIAERFVNDLMLLNA